MRRISLVFLAAPALSLAVQGPASAAPITTITHEHGVVHTFVDVINGCDEDGPLYTITATANEVEKETLNDDGTFHGTSTFTARLMAVPLDPSLPTMTGRFTGAGSFNGTRSTLISRYSYSISLKGPDGSKYSENEIIHYNMRPDGTENFFGHCNN